MFAFPGEPDVNAPRVNPPCFSDVDECRHETFNGVLVSDLLGAEGPHDWVRRSPSVLGSLDDLREAQSARLWLPWR